MGNTNSCTLSEDDLTTFSSSTVFSVDEVKSLWVHFKGIAGSDVDHISRTQFQEVMLFRDTAILDRIFRVFDTDEDQKISFSEYLSCISIISMKASETEKLKLSFGKITAAA